MVLPVPASTDPAADAYKHVNALADAITAAMSGRPVSYWNGTVTTNGNGDFIIPGLDGVLSHCAGAVVNDQGTNPTPHIFVFRGAGAPGVAYVRVYTSAGGAFGAGSIAVSVLAYGTAA